MVVSTSSCGSHSQRLMQRSPNPRQVYTSPSRTHRPAYGLIGTDDEAGINGSGRLGTVSAQLSTSRGQLPRSSGRDVVDHDAIHTCNLQRQEHLERDSFTPLGRSTHRRGNCSFCRHHFLFLSFFSICWDSVGRGLRGENSISQTLLFTTNPSPVDNQSSVLSEWCPRNAIVMPHRLSSGDTSREREERAGGLTPRTTRSSSLAAVPTAAGHRTVEEKRMGRAT